MSRRLLLLTIALLMFPQLAQTLYSPALADLAERFALPPSAASQAMSLYLFGFAAGVLLWGRLADRIGRRPALLWPRRVRTGAWAGCWPAASARSCWPRRWPQSAPPPPRW
jgi:MFS family permease